MAIIPTSKLERLSNQELLLALQRLQVKPYKIYSALLTQSGTDAPVPTVLENTIGNIVWTRGGAGIYAGTLTGAFITDKTALFIQKDNRTNTGISPGKGTEKIIFNDEDTNNIYIYTYGDVGDAEDGVLYKLTIEIRVYK